MTHAANYRPGRPMPRNNIVSGTSREGHSSASASRKRSSCQAGALLHSSKRSRSVSSTKAASPLPNWIHRRVILRDYVMPIYKASSRSALLAAFERCIEGHEPLHKARFLHRDISVNNLMINEDDDNSSWPSVLIHLGLAIPPELMPLPGHLAPDIPQSHPPTVDNSCFPFRCWDKI
ncbi:hypothetical protein BFJ66_g17620 [Fusarium oxysporum f. sp. cepae]|nr:hypothetical protein BFJ67_g17450 [Fusarium oxysporum f. sp. cepae]RKK21358.1 hypothetical protein BFJ66_g17620 [Fusarium oxysporum f. sp. cepae]